MFEKTLQMSDIPIDALHKLQKAEGLENMLGKDAESIQRLNSMLQTNIRIMRQEADRLAQEEKNFRHLIEENTKKVEINRQLPYLVSDVLEVIDVDLDDNYDENDNFYREKNRKKQKTQKKGINDKNGKNLKNNDKKTKIGEKFDKFDYFYSKFDKFNQKYRFFDKKLNDFEFRENVSNNENQQKNNENLPKNNKNSTKNNKNITKNNKNSTKNNKNSTKNNKNDKNRPKPDENIKKTSKKCGIIRTTTRQTIFLPVIGTVSADDLEPNDLVGANKDSYLVLEKLPAEFDSHVKAFEIDEKPTEDYSDVGGLDKQIEELCEAVVLPITQPERFAALGISPPKGVLLHGPPGTGKTLLARACAAKTNACFLKIAAPQLVQMYTGDGARIVRDVFRLAATKAPCVIFVDEIDAIGTKRFDSERSGDREVQRTMLELLNQLDGFSSNDSIKVIACTNRPDVLDPALMRSGRLDRKIEFPLPDENSRMRILAIHSRRMKVGNGVNFKELARSTSDFNGAQLKAVCVEAGMIALRRNAAELSHEDYVDGITQVLQKKKANLDYYA